MEYCPFCAASISEGAKTCHNCKKSLDISAFSFTYAPEKNISALNKKVLREIWFKEHSRFIWPFVTLIIGFILGGLLTYGSAQLQFNSEREVLQNKIAGFEAEIQQFKSAAVNQDAGLQQSMKQKDHLIDLLTQERQTLSRIINFTRRLARTSVISSGSPAETKTFRANVAYLKRQFDKQQAQIDGTGLLAKKTFNVLPIPQLMKAP